MNEWHVIRLSRTGREGYLQVDKLAAEHGTAKGRYTQLTLSLDLFLGGHRNYDEVAKKAEAKQSFKGCIQKVGVVCKHYTVEPVWKDHLIDHKNVVCQDRWSHGLRQVPLYRFEATLKTF